MPSALVGISRDNQCPQVSSQAAKRLNIQAGQASELGMDNAESPQLSTADAGKFLIRQKIELNEN
jgi:hypothetical protein